MAGQPEDRPTNQRLEADYVLGLQALWALLYLEFDGLAFVQAFVALGLDRRKVYEYILTGLALDESVSLAGVEPLHSSLFFHFSVTSLNIKLFARWFASSPQKKAARHVALQPYYCVKSKHKSNKREDRLAHIWPNINSLIGRWCQQGRLSSPSIARRAGIAGPC
jgi:hypothetical protein